MPQINVAKREISCKVVYCGPGLSGKTTNIEVVHKKAPKASTGDLTSIATEGDRTLFFDYMPVDLGKIGGLRVKLQLYTVPGQEYYNATRKLVLQGVDGIVFVADSQPDKLDENEVSLRSLEQNLREQGLDLATLPLVIQWNKRDLPDALPVEELERRLNKHQAPTVEAVAVSGDGVLLTLRKISKLTLERVARTYAEPPGERAVREALRGGKPTPRGAAFTGPRAVSEPEAPGSNEAAPAARELTPAPVNTPSSTRRRAPVPIEPVAATPAEIPRAPVAPAPDTARAATDPGPTPRRSFARRVVLFLKRLVGR